MINKIKSSAMQQSRWIKSFPKLSSDKIQLSFLKIFRNVMRKTMFENVQQYYEENNEQT